MGACAACAGCPLAGLAKDAKAEEPAEPVDVGTAEDFSRDGVYDAHAASAGFFLIRDNGRLYAIASHCTHKRTLLKVKDGAFACPKHGARFSLGGKVLKAPAKKELLRYAIATDESGHITVNPSRTFGRDESADADSFVKVE
jgi:nitrite reductase/ring-hydroxylating ferredoxin subunit